MRTHGRRGNAGIGMLKEGRNAALDASVLRAGQSVENERNKQSRE